jgi:uncharacterized SAM-binding protein YcdF (DUF218 family)
MTEELYFKLVEASMQREGYVTTNAILFIILIGLIALMICSGVAYYSEDYRYKSDSKFPKLFYPSTGITIILLVVFTYSTRQCASYPSTLDVERIIKDLDRIKKINTKTEEDK